MTTIGASRSHIIKDIKVITKANVGSDHRLVVSKIKIDTYCERRRMVKRKNYIDKDALHHLSKDFEQLLSNRFHLLTLENDIDDHTSNIVDIIEETATSLAGRQRKSKKQKLSPETKLLMKKRREMKQDGNLNHIEYREVCKTVRKKIREDCRQFQIKEITERIKDNASIKKAKQQLSIGEKRISCVLSKSGQPITGQDQILERIEEFYTELYASND